MLSEHSSHLSHPHQIHILTHAYLILRITGVIVWVLVIPHDLSAKVVGFQPPTCVCTPNYGLTTLLTRQPNSRDFAHQLQQNLPQLKSLWTWNQPYRKLALSMNEELSPSFAICRSGYKCKISLKIYTYIDRRELPQEFVIT